MKKAYKLLIILAVAVVVLAAVALAATQTDWFSRGAALREAREAADGSPVLAEYHGHEVSRAMVDYQQKLAGGRSEREIVDTILRGYMMVEEQILKQG